MESGYSASQLDIISFCDAIDESRAVMTDRDKHIYNILSRSTPSKVCVYECGWMLYNSTKPVEVAIIII